MGKVKSLTNELSLLNGEGIRMVYNETYSGINKSLWDTHFSLTIVRSTIRAVEKGTFMVYWDIGYMLLDFMLSEEVIPFCGVDVMNLRK